MQLDGGTRDVEHRDEDEQPSSAEMHAGHLLAITRRAFERSVVVVKELVVDAVIVPLVVVVVQVEGGASGGEQRDEDELPTHAGHEPWGGPSEGVRRIVNLAASSAFSCQRFRRMNFSIENPKGCTASAAVRVITQAYGL